MPVSIGSVVPLCAPSPEEIADSPHENSSNCHFGTPAPSHESTITDKPAEDSPQTNQIDPASLALSVGPSKSCTPSKILVYKVSVADLISNSIAE
jgi:hypothetical protein